MGIEVVLSMVWPGELDRLVKGSESRRTDDTSVRQLHQKSRLREAARLELHKSVIQARMPLKAFGKFLTYCGTKRVLQWGYGLACTVRGYDAPTAWR